MEEEHRQKKWYARFRLRSLIAGFQEKRSARFRLRSLTVVGFLAAALLVVISSVALAAQGSSVVTSGFLQSSGPNPHYVPSSAFGDTDDLPASMRTSKRLVLPAGTSSVSGVVTDATTGQPVANAQVGISVGTVSSAAQYTTTASDGSYSFTGIASGTYNLEADRYTISGTQPFYKDAQQMQVNVSTNTTVNFSLTPIAVPGSRTVPGGRAKNLIIVDFDETYYESWFSDTNSMVNKSPNTHQISQAGVLATNAWTQYGWSPIDHYQIAVGSYPAWRSPDAPAQAWGQSDGLDTNLWYNGSEVFGQESIFDVAKSYGMSTGVIGGDDYPTGHITDANVDQISLGSNINGVPTQWDTEVENFITSHASNPNGFLVYMPITEAEGSSVESTSPDDSSSSGLYQQASTWDDQAFGQLLTWLQQNNYMSNTDLSITADEAENDHTSFDNFYGLGSTGMGTTRHNPFVLEGPGIVSGQTYNTQMGIDDYSANYMYALGLPSPVDSRGQVIPSFFTPGGTPTPTPSPTPQPTPSPTPQPTPSPTPQPTPSPTPQPTPTPPPSPTPSPTPTPPPSNLIQNGGFETSGGWTLGGTPLPVTSTTEAHSGSQSLLVGGTSGQQGDSTASQLVTIPSSATQSTLSFWYWPASNDSSTYGWQEANVVNSSGQVLQQLFQTTVNNRVWTQMTFDLSAYAGQTIGIQFLDHENSDGGSYYTYMYVDDVSLTTNTSGSTPTPIPSPTPQPSINLIQNGGYETSGGWTFGGTPLPVTSTTEAHSGTHSLLVGGTSGQQGDSTTAQSVTIPSSATQATLSFWYWSASNDSSTYGWQEANVVNSSGQVLQQLFQTTANNGAWTQLTFNLSAYAGQTISIQFLDHENSDGGSYYTYMYVDDVALNVN